MDLKVGFAIISLCVFTIHFTEAGIPKCCITTKKEIPPHILAKVQRWEMQQSTGACDIDALILHVKNKRRPICAHLTVLNDLYGLIKNWRVRHMKKRWS